MTKRDQYASLRAVLDRALAQASNGKGSERHSSGEPFEEQPIVKICDWLDSDAFAIGQAIKKLRESARLPLERATFERLGAINYICAAIIRAERKRGGKP